MSSELREVGIVEALYRYPVKSMQGECITATHVGWQGLAGDRRWAFSRIGSDSGLPWLSAREYPTMLRYAAHCVDLTDESKIDVTSPEGDLFGITDPALCRELRDLCRQEITLFHLWRGTFDCMPISLITTQSIDSVQALERSAQNVERFRPNVLVAALENKAYIEERWIGDLLVFGDRSDSARIRIARKDTRCSIVNIEPRTGENNSSVLREIVASRKNNSGVYGIVERPGSICTADRVWLAK